MKSRIHIIRHGITEGNQKRWYYGNADIPLIEEGFENLRELKEQGIYPEVDADTLFITSGMIRTRQTLETIYGERNFETIPKLKELDCGEMECKTYEELKEVPRFYEYFHNYSHDLKVPGGESLNGFYARTGEGFQELLVKHELQMIRLRNRPKEAVTVAVIHGGSITSTMSRYFGNGVDDSFWTWLPKPGRGYTLYMEDGAIVSYEKI